MWEPRVTLTFLNSALEPQQIFMQNGSNDVDSHKDVPFADKKPSCR